MATLDVFNSNAFSLTSLSSQVEKVDYVPGLIGSLGIFEPVPVRNRTIGLIAAKVKSISFRLRRTARRLKN